MDTESHKRQDFNDKSLIYGDYKSTTSNNLKSSPSDTLSRPFKRKPIYTANLFLVIFPHSISAHSEHTS